MKSFEMVAVVTTNSIHNRIAKTGNGPRRIEENVQVRQCMWVDNTRYTAEKLREIRKQETNFKGEPRR